MDSFIPADRAPRLSMLDNAFAVLPPALARAAIERHTQAGDVILDPFGAGLGVIQAALELKRRVIVTSFNPINLLAVAATLWPPDARAALTHLADAPKGVQRLRDHVQALYATRCPTCGQPATALAFTWERAHGAPLDKRAQCVACGENIGPLDADDLAALTRYEARGLPFWLLHNRAVDREHEEADRVSEVLDAYLPRTQAALSDIVLKFEALSAADQAALRPALLATFDACTALHPLDDTRAPLSLKAPARFVEKNVWLELERQAARLRGPASAFTRVATPADLLAADSPAVCLLATPARDLAKQLGEAALPIIITHPPLPRPAFWSLSAIWAAWLWGKHSSPVEHLQTLLSRKRTSWDWQWRAIGSALSTLQPALRPDSRLVMSFPAEEANLDSVLLAAASAGYATEHLACDPFDGVQATWQRSPLAGALDSALDGEPSSLQPALALLRARAEPTSAVIVRAGLLKALGRTSRLADIAERSEGEPTPLAVLRGVVKEALEQPPLLEVEPRVWWLAREEHVQPPLADRVELIVSACLRDRAEWSGATLLGEIYRRFPGDLTPDRALLATTLHSYADEGHFDRVQLRAEDRPDARAAEMREIEETLLRVGQRLGYEVRGPAPVVWSEAGEVVYVFVIQSTAEVFGLLRESTGVLVIPGGRATLLQYKVARDVRLRARLAPTAWHVLKFSALRRAARQPDLSPQTFPLAFGLEPPIEQPETQIQLL